MKPPGPPPTMPRRRRRVEDEVADASMVICSVLDCDFFGCDEPRWNVFSLAEVEVFAPRAAQDDNRLRQRKTKTSEAEHFAVGGLVGAGGGEIVECCRGGLDDVARDEGGAFGGALFGGLDAAFPFEDGPAGEIVLSQFGEDCGEIDLAVAERAEAAGAIDPRLKAAVDALATGRAELGVLDVKHLDALVVEVDVFEIVELLQDEVARVEKNVAARMIFHAVEEHFEAGAVVKIFAGVDFEAEVDADFVEFVEDRSPAFGEFVEGSFDEAGGTLRPRIHVRPGERAGKCDVRGEAEILRGFRGMMELLDGPGLARFGIVADFGAAKPSNAAS